MLGVRLSDPVSHLVRPVVATIGSTATLRQAAESLAAGSIGLLVVVDPRGVAGVLSERDVVAAVADGAVMHEDRVRDHLTDVLVAVDERASILDAVAAMAAAEVRHLAITRDDVVVGVLSVRDVLDVLLEQGDHVVISA